MRSPSIFSAAILLVASLAGCSSHPAPKEGCTANSDCPTGQVCSAAKCVIPVQPMCGTEQVCQKDSDCQSVQCGDDGCCYALCTTDSDCTASQQCGPSGVCEDIGVSCTRNADCPHLSAPVCDTSMGACVQCTQNNECPAGSLCQGDACTTSTINCSSNVDCTVSALPVCDTSVPGGECVACDANSDCPSGDTCANHVCVQPQTGCTYDGDCANNPAGLYCAANGMCVACLVNSDCPVNSLCEPNDTCSSASTCVSDANCPPSRPHCRPSDHFCAECALNSQCPTGQICKNGYCEPPVNGCLSNADCSPPLGVCDLADRTCIGCLSDADCGAFCVNGVCQGCSTDSDCESNLTTLAAGRIFCNSDKACVQCVGNDNCSGSEVCGADGTCVANPVNLPCPAGGVCAGGLTCFADGTSTGTCRQPCDPYSNDQCTSGYACAVEGYESGALTGVCLPSIPGSSEAGQACSATQPCDYDALCLPNSPTTSECFALCDPDESSENCPTNCEPVVQLTSGNVPVAIGVCLSGGAFSQPCSSAAGCDTGEVCIAEGNPFDPATLENACWWPGSGSGAAGASCSHPTDCQSGLCLIGMPQDQDAPGFCQGSCTLDSQCPARWSDSYPGACAAFPAPWYDENGNPETTPIVTCITQCRSDSECPSGKTCDVTADVSGQTWATRCVATSSTSTAEGGSICFQDSDCFSDHCLSLVASDMTNGTITNGGICAGVCKSAADCASGASCPSEGVELEVSNNVLAPAPICWTRSCTTNEQCGPSGVCTGSPAPDNPDDVVLNCIPTQGSKEGGAACAQDSDCESGWCVTWGNNVDQCFGACGSNSDCASGSQCDVNTYWTNTTPHNLLSYCAPAQ